MEQFNTDNFLSRFKERADAVKKRSIPPVGGDDRNAFIKQAELDYLDYSLIANSELEITSDNLIFKIELGSAID